MKTMFLENSHLAYCVDDCADGDWIVFVHAAFADSGMFKKQYEYFSGKYKLLAIDLPGHGNSVGAGKGEGIDKTADWLNAVFIKHGIAAAHFVGVSLGAVVIQDFANKYSGKVLSLACFGGYDINDFDVKKQKSNSGAQMKMMFKAMFSVKWFAASNKKISAYTEEAQEEFYKMNIKFKKRSFMHLAGLKNLVNKYPKKQRNYRLLVGCGEHDIAAEIETVNEWAAKENCEKAVIKGAGHCANMDSPNEFNICLENFFRNR